jgi:membrane-associated phospholipid phosphatase
MESLWSAGIAMIVWLQSLGPGLTTPMKLLTFLGKVEFYLLLMPALYWCWDSRKGLRLGVLLMLSGGLNEALKIAFHQPRPFWVSSTVEALSVETTFGLPSGHAQQAVCVLGWLSHQKRRAWAWGLAGLLVVLISFSRAYLGVHFPHSLLIGSVVGAVLLWAFVRWEPRASAWLVGRSLAEQLWVALLGSLTLLGLSVVALAYLRGWSVPAAWTRAALEKTGEPIEALTPSYALMSAGVLFGMGAGAAWLQHCGGFSAGGTTLRRVLRYVVGMAVVAVLWFGLESLLPQDAGPVVLVLRYLHASLVGFWVAGGAPRVFGELGLADESSDRKTACGPHQG